MATTSLRNAGYRHISAQIAGLSYRDRIKPLIRGGRHDRVVASVLLRIRELERAHTFSDTHSSSVPRR